MSSTGPMLSIDRLTLALPGEYGTRAASIARCLGEELSRRPLAGSAELSMLRVTPAPLPSGLSDRQVALRIADSIHARIGSETPAVGKQATPHD
ncbi:MAG: hypothetical protein KDK91_20515 [Gammaproteobacteria bacterium]|nr:hypothetical protein [Gammaproteobacteria bacterium]